MSYIPFKGKERPEQTTLFPAKLRAVLVTLLSWTLRSVSLRGVRLCAVLVTF